MTKRLGVLWWIVCWMGLPGIAVTEAEAFRPTVPPVLHPLWEGGDRCGVVSEEQWRATLDLPLATASALADDCRVVPFRFQLQDLVAGIEARAGSPAAGSPKRLESVRNPPPLKTWSSNPFGFTGHEHDAETGLIYMKARFYDPDTGRFLSEDPFEGDATVPPSLHRYTYAYQNPTVYVDPTGEVVETAFDAASLGLGLYSLHHNLSEGNLGAAGLDSLGVLADSLALAVPFLPGGVGFARSEVRPAASPRIRTPATDRVIHPRESRTVRRSWARARTVSAWSLTIRSALTIRSDGTGRTCLGRPRTTRGILPIALPPSIRAKGCRTVSSPGTVRERRCGTARTSFRRSFTTRCHIG